MKSIFIYGGSFNPPHTGHLAIIDFILKNNLCSKLLILPAGNPPHKEILNNNISKRLKILNLALQESVKKWTKERIALDTREIDKSLKTKADKNYTVDTLRELQKDYPDYKQTLIIGLDMFLIFPQWKNWQEILKNCSLLIFPRFENKIQNIIKKKSGKLYLSDNELIQLYPELKDKIKNILREIQKIKANYKTANFFPPAISSKELRKALINKNTDFAKQYIPEKLFNDELFKIFYS